MLCRSPILSRRVETCIRPSQLTEVTATCLEDLLAWYFTEPSASKKPLRPYPTSDRDTLSISSARELVFVAPRIGFRKRRGCVDHSRCRETRSRLEYCLPQLF